MIKRKSLEWYLALFALLTIIFVWWLGKNNSQDQTMRQIRNYFPVKDYTINKTEGSDAVWKLSGENNKGYLSKANGKGYAGSVTVLAEYSNDYQVRSVIILSHQETPSYFKKVLQKDYLDYFTQKKWDHFFKKNREIDVISGATKSSEAIYRGVQSASIQLASAQNLKPIPDINETGWQIGFKEVVVVVIFLMGILSRFHKFRYKKYLKWATLMCGMVFIGFVFNEPITITRVNSFLIGFWPDWHSELYIYLLFFGVLLILLTSGKNVYCHTFCPFGALQELTGKLGKAGNVRLKSRYFWMWFQRSLAWIAILLALFFRNPGISEYEVFGAVFQFTGSVWLFLLLGIVLIASFIIRKPWCNYFCPVNPIFGFIQLFRNKIKSLWQKT